MIGSESVDGSGQSSGSDASTWNLRTAVQEFERRHITNVLASAGGDKVEAARRLRIGLSSLYRKLNELGMLKNEPSEASASCEK